MPSALPRRHSRGASDLLKHQVLLCIQSHGPITASAIADAIPVLSDDNVRVVRKKVRELIMADRIPIASSMKRPYGYFIIDAAREADADAYCRQLRSRLEAIAQRLALFRSSCACRLQEILFEEFGSADTSDMSDKSHPEKEASCPE